MWLPRSQSSTRGATQVMDTRWGTVKVGEAGGEEVVQCLAVSLAGVAVGPPTSVQCVVRLPGWAVRSLASISRVV
jgi:hypothetical protein